MRDVAQRAVIAHYKQYLRDYGLPVHGYDEYEPQSQRACLKIYTGGTNVQRIATLTCEPHCIYLDQLHPGPNPGGWFSTEYEYEDPATFGKIDLQLARLIDYHLRGQPCPK
jgi:hypothetical protein